MTCGLRRPWWFGAELLWLDAKRTAVVQLVPFGDTAVAVLPAADVAAHGVAVRNRVVAAVQGGPAELAGHLSDRPAANLALPPPPPRQFGKHSGSPSPPR